MEKSKKDKFTRNLAYASLLLAYFLVQILRNSPSAVKSHLDAEFGLTTLQYSNLSSAFFYAYALIQIPAGILLDTVGIRRTALGGVALMTLGSLLHGISGSYGMLFVSRLIMGLGSGVIFLSILKYLAAWYEENRFSTMTGLSSCVANIGAAVSQAPLVVLSAVFSWQLCFYLSSGVCLLAAVLIFLLVRDRPAGRAEPVGAESDIVVSSAATRIGPGSLVGRENGGASFASYEDGLEKKTVSDTRTRRFDSDGQTVSGALAGMGRVLANRYNYIPLLINFLAQGIYVVGFTWTISYLTDLYGVSMTHAGTVASVIPVVAAVFTFSAGRLCDVLGRRRPVGVFCAGLILVLLGILAFVGAEKPPLVLAYAALMSSGVAVFYAIYFGLAKDLNPPELSGISTGLLNMSTFLGASAFPVIFGAAINRFGRDAAGYRLAYRMLFACAAVLLLLCLIAKETGMRNRWEDIQAGRF